VAAGDNIKEVIELLACTRVQEFIITSEKNS